MRRDRPMARKASSRQPDISLLMLSSMSLPETFWYSSNTAGGETKIMLVVRLKTVKSNDNVTELNIKSIQLTWHMNVGRFNKKEGVCSSNPTRGQSNPHTRDFCYHFQVRGSGIMWHTQQVCRFEHICQYAVRIPRIRWFWFLTQSTVRNLTSSVPHRASPAS